MIVHFTVTSSGRHARIEKEGSSPHTSGMMIPITVDEAREAWNNVGTIKDCNIPFRRLATEFDFDVAAYLNWYREQVRIERKEKTDVA